MTDPDLLDRVRKALESVPMKKFTASCVDGCFLGDEMKMEMEEPDYHALAAKVAPLVEALERRDCHAPVPGLECPYCEPALAHFWAHGGEPMKSAEEVAGEIDIPCQCCCGDGYICTPHKNIALALRAARAEVWEEAAKMIEGEGRGARYTEAQNAYAKALDSIALAFRNRARLSEPPRGPGQGEEGR